MERGTLLATLRWCLKMPICDNDIEESFKGHYQSSHSFNTSKTPTKTSEIDFGFVYLLQRMLLFFPVTILCKTSSNPSFSVSIQCEAKESSKRQKVREVWKQGRRFLVLARAAFYLLVCFFAAKSLLCKMCEGEDTNLRPSAFFFFSQLQVQLNLKDRKTLDWFTAVGDTFWCGEWHSML